MYSRVCRADETVKHLNLNVSCNCFKKLKLYYSLFIVVNVPPFSLGHFVQVHMCGFLCLSFREL